MGKAILILLIICFLISDPICHAQSIHVSDPRLELIDNQIHISYDILNSDPSDKFIVSIHITDAKGKKIKAKALTGDIGKEVSGGSNKLITWDLSADKILMNSSIYVKINAKAVPVPEPVQVVQEITPEQDNPEKDNSEDTDPEAAISEKKDSSMEPVQKEVITLDNAATGFNRTGIILQSIALPGLGLSRIHGNPHWLRGVAGYGCIAGSYILNREAISTYGGISDLENYEEKNELFKKSKSQDNMSEVLAYAAIGIWITDIIWTLVGTSDLKLKSSHSDANGFSLKTTLDPLTYTPLVGLSYKF